jgi:DNA invertase Pin-like site-specific DNA recombinase
VSEKVGVRHLQRTGIVYVRQSSQHQVQHYRESQRLQYSMEQRLRSLGWREVEVIDEDLGCSGASAAQRSGFRRMVAEVGLGKVGAVAAREVSRFARNNRDWHQLVEMCSLVDTLLIDHEAIYDARRSNDRLLLGLKGSLSEYELDLLRQRSLEARWQKARRGELVQVRPVGFMNTEDGRLEMDPDRRVQHALRLVFEKFFELGSARQVLMWFIEEGLQLPTRRYGAKGWGVHWKRPAYRMVIRLLTDPVYAGAYVFGRTVEHKEVQDGEMKKKRVRRAIDEIPVLIREHHEGYVSWTEFERIQQMLASNARGFDATRPGAAKKGPALLAGLLRCRRCGRKLSVHYTGRERSVPRYMCIRGRLDTGDAKCISFGGLAVDDAVSREVLAVVRPGALEAARLAASETRSKQDEVVESLGLELEAARYEAQRAWKQFDAVDPDNRLVADELERRWNAALERERDIEAKVERERAHSEQHAPPSVEQFHSLARDLQDVWTDPQTDVRLKKRIIRALIEEVVVDIDDEHHELVLVIHWKGGVHSELRLARRRRGQSNAHTTPDVVDAIRILARICTDEAIAAYLNRNGILTGRGNRWTKERVASSRSKRKIPRFTPERRDQDGWMNLTEAAKHIGVSQITMRRAVERGEVEADHPLADGPWIFKRDHLDDPEIRGLFAHLVAAEVPGKPASKQLPLTISGT